MKEKEWESHVRAQLKSGLSQQAYSRRHGLKAGTFAYWSAKLRKKESAERRRSRTSKKKEIKKKEIKKEIKRRSRTSNIPRQPAGNKPA